MLHALERKSYLTSRAGTLTPDRARAMIALAAIAVVVILAGSFLGRSPRSRSARL
jgi:hypothetical protein